VTKQVIEQILAFGHENILATHPTTLMITKDKEITKKGDCIIAVGANKAVSDLSVEFKQKLCSSETVKLEVLIQVDNLVEQIIAYGSTMLDFSDNRDMVIRKSNVTSNRTLAVKADKAAINLPREFVKKLGTPEQQIKITLSLTT
jgi:hypothetical protein